MSASSDTDEHASGIAQPALPEQKVPLLGIVVPSYNEVQVLHETAKQLRGVLDGLINRQKIASNSSVYFVDDGSRDGTWQLIESLAKQHSFVHGVKLSRNQGHQNALLAGLFSAAGEILISVDADLQDDLGVIEQMIDEHESGADIVYGVRKNRVADTLFKRFTAEAYYKVLNWLGVEVVFNHADYRCMSRRAVDALREFAEVNLFLRGIIPLLGFRTSSVYYDRTERFAGESKYPLKKMLSFAWQGVTSFSTVPLRIITSLGLFVSLGSFGVTVWALAVKLLYSDAVPGWASTVLPIYFLGGIQLLSIGIIGEYTAKIYLEAKRRPRFIIEKII